MTKYELSLTKDYVPDWTVLDAIRELFQNALDQETVAKDNTMFWDYSEGTFSVGNKLSILEPKSLLLGATTKADDSKTIGKFGEGYKIATLVLTRLGKTVTFYNYGAKEVWRARFSKSKKYGAEILVFEVDKKFPWTTVPDNNLTIHIEGITEQEFEDIKGTNLHIANESVNSVFTPHGEVLLDAEMKGKMFVNGLYICTSDIFKYGYNFNPDKVSLDRDRKLIRDFDLKWTTSQMWLSSKDVEVTRLAADLVDANAPDTEYIVNAAWDKRDLNDISYEVAMRFVSKNGDKAVPVSTQSEAELVPKTHRPIIVTQSVADMVKRSDYFVAPKPAYVPTFTDKVEDWLNTYGSNIKRDYRRELQALLTEERAKDKKDSEIPF